MRVSRLFLDMPLTVGSRVILPKESAHYLTTVLRLRPLNWVIVFNGQGGEYLAQLVVATKKQVELAIADYQAVERESPLPLTLVQAISRPEHIDYSLQKAVELGVSQIIPIITERSPPLQPPQWEKRRQHWQKIIINAGEQCGRNRLPWLPEIQTLTRWLESPLLGTGLVLSPQGKNRLLSIQPKELTPVTCLIGPEGGLTDMEIQQAIDKGYLDLFLGPRVLRTETAATAILAIAQAWWGDF
jgi:16S rRNA (uracil1498-N3)-methyltransferase